METLLRIEELEKYYGAKTLITKALDNISFSVEKGEFLGIMGASGSGKTTLLNCISTIDTATAGHIYLRDTDITGLKEDKLAEFRQKNLGFVFQDFNLLDTLTIEENIALAPVIQGTSPPKNRRQGKKMWPPVSAYRISSPNSLMKYPAGSVSGVPAPGL